MTLEEAQKVAAICSTADGGCGPCVESLADLLSEAFPAFAFETTQDEFGYQGPPIVVTEKAAS